MPCPSDAHLAEILAELYESPEELLQTAEKCYQRATDVAFQWDTVAAEFHKVFQEVLSDTYELEQKEVSPVAIEKKSKKRKRKKAV